MAWISTGERRRRKAFRAEVTAGAKPRGAGQEAESRQTWGGGDGDEAGREEAANQGGGIPPGRPSFTEAILHCIGSVSLLCGVRAPGGDQAPKKEDTALPVFPHPAHEATNSRT